MHKRCTKCLGLKETTEFNKHGGAKANKDGFRPTCKACDVAFRATKKEQLKAWAKKNEVVLKAKAYDKHLQKRYGITTEQYNKLFSTQNGCCVVCDRHQSNFKNSLAVDHDHLTGEIRGLLCNSCNHAIGMFQDDPVRFDKCAAYLRQGKQTVLRILK